MSKLIINTDALKQALPAEVMVELQKNATTIIAEEVVRKAKASGAVKQITDNILRTVNDDLVSKWRFPQAAKIAIREAVEEQFRIELTATVRKMVREEIDSRHRSLDESQIKLIVKSELRNTLKSL